MGGQLRVCPPGKPNSDLCVVEQSVRLPWIRGSRESWHTRETSMGIDAQYQLHNPMCTHRCLTHEIDTLLPCGKGPKTTGFKKIPGGPQSGGLHPVSGYQFRIWGPTYQSGGLQPGALQSRATDFGSDPELTCALHRLRAYSLEACSLGPPILDLPIHLPVLYIDWGPTVWGPTVSGQPF